MATKNSPNLVSSELTEAQKEDKLYADRLRRELPGFAEVKWNPFFGQEYRVEVRTLVSPSVFDAINAADLRVAELYTDIGDNNCTRIVAIPA